MKRLILAALTATPFLASAATGSPDEAFYQALAEGGTSEVELGNLAQEKSSDQKVKDFGAMMVKDHSAANEKLQALAASKTLTLPSGAGAAGMATKAKLEMLKGGTFDKSYIKSQIKAHTATVSLLDKEISSGQDPDAKTFAQSVLPTVRAHLEAIRTIATEENVKT
jgi:putative membrane protein